MIRFLLDDEEITLGDDTAADLTVLDWLRVHKRRTGTKEGCGSGDCGACTVVVAELTGDSGADSERGDVLSYKAINSCITFIGALHGKQLLTVESLADGDQLHPVQAAMVSEHGSQCGFCTPGFVMSLYALYQADDAPALVAGAGQVSSSTESGVLNSPTKDVSDWHADVRGVDLNDLSHRIDRTIGGNLCRCTGYRPIKHAAVVALLEKQRATTSQDTQWQVGQSSRRDIANRLGTLNQKPATSDNFQQPRNVQAFADYYLSNPDAHILAGGTDLALDVTQKLKTLSPIISTTQVSEMLEVVDHGDEWQIGAAVTLNRCLDLFTDTIPTVETLLLRFGSDQVRNQGTIGGNLGSASPIGDLPPMLLALDARLHLQQGSSVREVPLSDYFLDYRKTQLQRGEFIRSISIPKPATTDRFATYKISKRMEDDISSVCAAFRFNFDGDVISDARIAYGGMAAIPLRVTEAETLLQGTRLTQSGIKQAQTAIEQSLKPIDDARASAHYRRHVAVNLLHRFWLELEHSGASAPTQVSEIAELTGGNPHG